MRRLLGVIAVLGILTATVAWGQPSRTRDVLSYTVDCTTSVTHVATANLNRENLTLLNAGTLHANVGRRLTSTTYGANNAFKGMTLHAGSWIELRGYRGGLECQTQSGTGSTSIEVLEEIN